MRADSGIVDLATLMHDNGLEGALARVKASGRASSVFDEGAAPSLAPVDLNAWAARPALEEPAARPRAWRVGRVLFALTIAALVLAWTLAPVRYRAAAVAWFAKVAPVPAPSPEPPAVTRAPPPPPPAPVAAPAPSVAAAAPSVVVPAATAAPAEEDLTPPRRGRAAGRASAPVAKATRTRTPKPHRAAADPAPPPAAPPPTSALASALRDAAGAQAATEPAADAAPAGTRATSGTEARPERPSGSAVASAITRVLPAARACLGDVPDASRATISFGPDGAVQKVDVTGPAAASPKQGPCIRDALGRAHVPPFSQSSYTASVTVRPR